MVDREGGPARADSSAALIVQRAAGAVLVLFSGYLVLRFLQIALARIDHPFDLEWMEGSMVDAVARVIAGDPIYAAPSHEFISFLYTPLYYQVAAGVAQFTGLSHCTLRAVSLAAAVGCFALTFSIARRLSGSLLVACVTTGMLAASYPLSGFWFDLARVDMLWLFLVLLGYALYARAPGEAVHVGPTLLVGLAWTAAFWTKQFSAAILALILIADVLVHPRRAIGVGAVAALAGGALFLVTQFATDGWLGFYTFTLPAQHPIVGENILGFWLSDLPRFSLPFLATAVALALVLRQGAWNQYRLPIAFIAGLLLSAYSGRIHSGGWVNTLIPAHLALCVGLALAAALAPSLHGRWLPLTALLCLAQFLVLSRYPAEAQIPSIADRARGEAIIEQIRATGDDTFVPSQGYISTRATGHMHAHYQGLWDIERSTSPEARALLAESLRAWKAEGAKVVLESERGPCDSKVLTGVEADPIVYTVQYRGFEFFPRTGCPTRPSVAHAARPLD